MVGFAGLGAFLFGLPPLINSIGNPRLATVHGLDVVRLVLVGFFFGFGLALLVSNFIFPVEG